MRPHRDHRPRRDHCRGDAEGIQDLRLDYGIDTNGDSTIAVADLLAMLDDRPLLRLKRSEASARIVEGTLEDGYVWADEENAYVATLPDEARLSALYQLLEDNGLDYRSLEMRPPTIENLFLHLTGRSLRE